MLVKGSLKSAEINLKASIGIILRGTRTQLIRSYAEVDVAEVLNIHFLKKSIKVKAQKKIKNSLYAPSKVFSHSLMDVFKLHVCPVFHIFIRSAWLTSR